MSYIIKDVLIKYKKNSIYIYYNFIKIKNDKIYHSIIHYSVTWTLAFCKMNKLFTDCDIAKSYRKISIS